MTDKKNNKNQIASQSAILGWYISNAVTGFFTCLIFLPFWPIVFVIWVFQYLIPSYDAEGNKEEMSMFEILVSLFMIPWTQELIILAALAYVVVIFIFTGGMLLLTL